MSRKSITTLAKTLLVSAATVSFVTVGAKQALSADFTFTNIADTNGQFSFVGLSPVINERGTVAFDADLDSGEYGIFRNDGGAITTIVDNKGVFSTFGSRYALNDNGTVAFTADLDGLNLQTGGRGLFTGSGGAINTIVDTNSPLFSNIYEPAINNSGTVAFGASRDTGGLGIFTSNDGLITTISNEGLRVPSINDNGTVAFFAVRNEGGTSVLIGSGGLTTTIADSSGSLSINLSSAINNNDTVVFNADFDTGGNGIFINKGGTITNFVNTSGPFSFVRGVSLNDNGEIAFGADLDAGGEGIFTGSDIVTDKVIATGDLLFGSTVTRLFAFSNNFLNNSGQIVFHAQLADGRRVITRAEPISKPPTAIPEPTSVLALVVFGILSSGATRARKSKHYPKKKV
jgi:hypothetical protein